MERTRDPLPAYQCPRNRPLQKSSIVWTGSALDSRTHFHVFETSTATAMKYSGKILEPCVYLFTGAVDSDFTSMDDKVRHIKLIWSTNFWKVRISTKWIGQLGLIRIEHA
ncbi:hypothetical protein TNCV_2080801 [Trichonephila clavipes]|nr:hypothetical protein TNCV_2080801 [Trichonephila clavipes]